MIVYENKGFMTNSLYPDTDWTGNAKYVVPDDSELAEKIKAAYPYYDFVEDVEGNLVDIVETERPEPEPEPEPEPVPEYANLSELAEAITEGVNSI